MMGCDASGNFDLFSCKQVTGSGLQEEEGFLGDNVVELLDVICIIATYCDDLGLDEWIICAIEGVTCLFAVFDKSCSCH